MSNTLTYHTVTGSFYSDVDPIPGSDPVSTTPQVDQVSAYVKFSYRLPQGFTALVTDFDPGDGSPPADASVMFPDRVARLMNGKLCTVEVGDPEGVEILSNSAVLALADSGITDLYIDVAFFNVTAAANQAGSLQNFSYKAPVDATPVNLTDPLLTKYAYGGTVPYIPNWQAPEEVSVTPLGNALMTAINVAAIIRILSVVSDNDPALVDTREPTNGSITPEKFYDDGLAMVISLLSGIATNIIRLGRNPTGTLAATSVEQWADDGVTVGGVRVSFATATGLNLLQPLRIGNSTFASNAKAILGTATGSLNRSIAFAVAGVNRFQMIEDGSAFTIQCCDATTGAVLFNAISVDRLTGRTTFGGPLTTLASATGAAGLSIPPGVAPSAPVNGEVWNTGTALWARLSSVSQQLATMTDVSAAVAALVNSSPTTLDTLKELADALGDDPNFATTMTTALGLRVLISAPVLNALPTGSGVDSAASASTLAARDANAALAASALLLSRATQTVSATTLTLGAGDKTVQDISGTGGTVKMAAADTPRLILNNGSGTLIIQASDASEIVRLDSGKWGWFWAGSASPAASTQWRWIAPSTSGSRGNTGVQRDANTNVTAGGYLVPPNTITAGATGGVSTVGVTTGFNTVIAGSATHAVKLSGSGLSAGQGPFTVTSQNTSTTTVQASDGTTITTLANGDVCEFKPNAATPTTSTQWRKLLYT